MSEVATTKPTEVAPASNPLDAIMQYAMSGNAVDMDVMRELMAMRKDMQAEAARVAYNEAMARAQSRMPVIKRDRTNSHTKSTYATYEQITKQIRPVYTAEGLSLSFDSEKAEDGYTRYICEVKHEAGHRERVSMELPPDDGGMRGNSNKNAVQALGSSMTYAKRYLTMEVFALAQSDDPDDDDGQSAARTDEWLREYNLFCRNHWDLIHDIKTAIANEDIDLLVGVLIDQREKDDRDGLEAVNRTVARILRMAPTKGGWLTVEEKRALVDEKTKAAFDDVYLSGGPEAA